MKNSTGIPALDRFIRSLLQLIVGGGLTALVTALTGGLDPALVAVVMTLCTLVVNFAQNMLEDMDKVPVILKGSSEAEYAQQVLPKEAADAFKKAA